MTNELLPVETKRPRPALDLSALPTVPIGIRAMTWWGTLGFAVIEGTTLAIVAAAYLYIRQNFRTWPPPHDPLPALLIPTINLVLMLVSIVPAWLTDRASRRLDRSATRLWSIVSAVLGAAILVLRWYEFWALGVRWDTDAYGSAAWTVIGFHTTLLVLEEGETIGMAAMLFKKRLPAHSFSDVYDSAWYWYFIVGIWVPLYVLVYLLPYWV